MSLCRESCCRPDQALTEMSSNPARFSPIWVKWIQSIYSQVSILFMTSNLGSFIRKHRTTQGWTQADLAKKLAQEGFSFTSQAISNWENGRDAPPIGLVNQSDRAFVSVLAELLEVVPLDLLNVARIIQSAPETDADDQELISLIREMSLRQKRALKEVARIILDHSSVDATGA